jgi:hypothetical protein
MTTQPQLAEEVLSLSIGRTTGDSHRRAGGRAPRRRRLSCAPGGWSTASRPPRALSGHASWLRLGAGLHGAELLRPAFAKEPTRSVVETRLRHHRTAAWVAERPTLGEDPVSGRYSVTPVNVSVGISWKQAGVWGERQAADSRSAWTETRARRGIERDALADGSSGPACLQAVGAGPSETCGYSFAISYQGAFSLARIARTDARKSRAEGASLSYRYVRARHGVHGGALPRASREPPPRSSRGGGRSVGRGLSDPPPAVPRPRRATAAGAGCAPSSVDLMTTRARGRTERPSVLSEVYVGSF